MKCNLPDGKRSRENNIPKYYIESDDKKILQKIKIGYPFDTTFDPNLASVGEMHKDDFISQQMIQMPYMHIYTNPRTLNLFLADAVVEDDHIMHSDYVDHNSQNGIVILILDREYRYIRSSVTEDLGEIISTFNTDQLIGCIILLNNEGIKNIPTLKNTLDMQNGSKESFHENVLCCDTKFGDDYIHIRLNISTDEDSVTYLYPVISETCMNRIKNPMIIEKLDKMLWNTLDNSKINKRERRFVRTSKKLITNYVIVPNDLTKSDGLYNFSEFLDKHGTSLAVNPDNEIMVLGVNTDENGFIIKDETFDGVISYMKEQKVKAFTIIGCDLKGQLFSVLRPSYIFIMDSTESVIDDKAKALKCLRSG